MQTCLATRTVNKEHRGGEKSGGEVKKPCSCSSAVVIKIRRRPKHGANLVSWSL